MRVSSPLKLAYFSPLPPARSGIADYSRDLLPYLGSWAEVHPYVDDATPLDPPIAWQFPVRPHREYPWRRELHGYDCGIYHLGNNPLHGYVYPHVFRHPGVVVLHDLVLHHLLAWMAQYAGGAAVYLREMTYANGAAGAGVAWDVLTGARPAPFFDYPLCQRALDASLGVIVHSRYLEEQVQRLSPGTPVRAVPMGMPLGPQAREKGAARQRLGLPQEAFIVGCLGEATHHKRLDIVLRAFARVPDAFLVVVGNAAPGLDLTKEAARAGVARRSRITGPVPPEQFADYLSAVDVSVNLRYPTAGETSAAALRSLAAGLPTVVSDVGANRELPESCCFKLPVGDDEEPLLGAVLGWLAQDPARAAALGEAGRRYVAAEHAPERAAMGYVRFIEEVLNTPPRFRQRAIEPPGSAFVKEIASHIKDIGVGPEGEGFLREVADAMRIVEG